MIEQDKQDNTVGQNHTEADKQSREDNPANLREISYIILFVGAVFIINAMETGSYRTPWPVALITALAGIMLFGYSHFLKTKEQK